MQRRWNSRYVIWDVIPAHSNDNDLQAAVFLVWRLL